MPDGRQVSGSGLVYFADCRFDLGSGRLWRGEVELELRPKPSAVLSCLLSRPGEVVSKGEVLATVWPDSFVGDAVLMACINQLRHVLGDDSRDPRFIVTAHRRGYRFVAPVATAPQPADRGRRRSGPLVGREVELGMLDGFWQLARDGKRQVVLIAAQAGIGKTALVEELVGQLGDEERPLVGWGQCVEQFGEGEAYLPVLDALFGLSQGPAGHHVREVLRTLAPAWLRQLPGLLEPGDVDSLQVRTLGTSAAQMRRQAGDALSELTSRSPLVLVLEDLHLTDRSTIDLLAYLARRVDPARLLILGTYRPAEMAARSDQVAQVVAGLRAHRRCELLPLELLDARAVADYLAHRLAPSRPARQLVEDVHRRTDGNALFVSTLLEYLVDRGLLDHGANEVHSAGPLDSLGIPDGVRQFIERQLAELSPPDRSLLEVASANGAEFDVEAVLAAARHDDPDLSLAEVDARCSRLACDLVVLDKGDVVSWPDGTVTGRYRFHHDLYQEVMYSGLGPARRVAIHRRIGERLESAYGSRPGDIAPELAMHFERGRDYDKAIGFLVQVATTAMQRVAHREALDYANRGLQLLDQTTRRAEHAAAELELRMIQALSLSTLRGYGSPGLEASFRQARTLCAQVDDPDLLAPVLYGLWNFAFVGGKLADATEVADELAALARRHTDPVIELQAHNAAGYNEWFAGRPTAALAHVEPCLALYDPAAHRQVALLYGEDPGVGCRQWAAMTSWLAGRPDQARAHAAEGYRLATALGYPNDIAAAVSFSFGVHLRRGELQDAGELCAILRRVAYAHDLLQFSRFVECLDGVVLVRRGDLERGIPILRRALTAYAVEGGEVATPDLSFLLAEALGRAGDTSAALETATSALDSARRTGELWCESDLVRLQGELLLRTVETRSPTAHVVGEAEGALLEALDIARRQQARSLELRAATSLARLWHSGGETRRARDLLGEVYDWFTEGHDTEDLRTAAELLVTLGARDRVADPRGHLPAQV
jgi:DNA-binding winged helix-turn-helix (wHTH) protein/predicted ATPase